MMLPESNRNLKTINPRKLIMCRTQTFTKTIHKFFAKQIENDITQKVNNTCKLPFIKTCENNSFGIPTKSTTIFRHLRHQQTRYHAINKNYELPRYSPYRRSKL